MMMMGHCHVCAYVWTMNVFLLTHAKHLNLFRFYSLINTFHTTIVRRHKCYDFNAQDPYLVWVCVCRSRRNTHLWPSEMMMVIGIRTILLGHWMEPRWFCCWFMSIWTKFFIARNSLHPSIHRLSFPRSHDPNLFWSRWKLKEHRKF